jgi:hypothetical protein
VTSSLNKAVADLARCAASASRIWFSCSMEGFFIKGYGLVTEATDQALRFENTGVHSLILWGMVKPEVEYCLTTEPDAMYLPAGFHPKSGWWRIVTEARAVIHIGEAGEPPVMH